MTLTELRYIVALARETRFGRAAQRCFVSQPTLSIAIKRLEDELGVCLFERKHNEVIPTAIGRQIIGQAERVLEEAEALKQIARYAGDPLSGALRVGSIYTIGPYLFPDLIPLMRDANPGMPLLVEENYTALLREKLKRSELDVIIIALPFEEKGVTVQALYDEPFVALLPGSHPLNQQSILSVADVEKETVLLLGQGHCFRDQVVEAFPGVLHRETAEGNHVDLQQSLAGSSLETIRYMVAGGIGITVLPCSAACADRYSQRLLTIRRFAKPVPSRRVALAWRSTFPRPQAVEALAAAIKACPLSCVEMLD